MGGRSEREGIYVYSDSLHCTAEDNTTVKQQYLSKSLKKNALESTDMWPRSPKSRSLVHGRQTVYFVYIHFP